MATFIILFSLLTICCVNGEIAKDQNRVQSEISPDSVKNDVSDNSKMNEKSEMTRHISYSEKSEIVENAACFVEEKGHRMALVTWRVTDSKPFDVTDCRLYGDNSTINKILQDSPKDYILSIGKDKMNEIIKKCSILFLSQENEDKSKTRISINFSRGYPYDYIYPDTKWCGNGNIAEGYDDLGPSKEADICCRAHDYCNDTLRPYHSRYGLINNASFPKSHCDCDNTFAECLLNAGTEVAHAIGKLYFNVLQMQCYKNDYPIVKCLKYRGLPVIHWSCQEYHLDKKKPMKWQFFDAKYYDGPK